VFGIRNENIRSGKLCIKGKVFYKTIYGEVCRTDFIFSLNMPPDEGLLLTDEHQSRYWAAIKPATKPDPKAFHIGNGENKERDS